MPEMQVRVGQPPVQSLPDGLYGMLGGKQGEGIVSELHGKYYTQTYRGKLWSASLASATAIPVFATSMTPNFFIINPVGNPNNVVLVRMNVSAFIATNGVNGTIGYAYMGPGLSAVVGTAAPISAATLLTIKPGMIGQQYGGNVLAGSAATSGGVNTQYQWKTLRHSNLSGSINIATSTPGMWSLFEDFDGDMIIPPGYGWALSADIALASTQEISVIAYEAPI